MTSALVSEPNDRFVKHMPGKQYMRELRAYLVRDHAFLEIERTGRETQSPFGSVLDCFEKKLEM